MDHFVKLDRLPAGYEFPAEMKERISFDAERHTLLFRGYMSKAEFDRMCESTKDWKFRRTLEELFCLCVPEEAPNEHGVRRLWDALRRHFIVG